ncbi:uncharacterized protein KQ657_000810 [Scheffersomyces spartinae]|uniref:Protein NBA1 n=1 Tax=Scheffersomyces spartinae TaxID=45513 RepID=A0A9P8AHI7_9ASCO|nr:uncharacterized protein KQ657_000810 [Scheffersomyces spartinae]KAG7193392.1 hypothetical protein KQ657_000810 [Scheffersomyces spartinae]
MNNSETSSVSSDLAIQNYPGDSSFIKPSQPPQLLLGLPNTNIKRDSLSGLKPPPPPSHKDRYSVILNLSTYSGKDYNAELMTINQVKGATVNIVHAKSSSKLIPKQSHDADYYKMPPLGKISDADASDYSSSSIGSKTKLPSVSADAQNKMKPVSTYKTAIEGSIPPRSSRRPKSEVIHGTPILPVKEDNSSHRLSLSDDLEKLMETASVISKGETSDSKQFIFKDIKKTFSLPKVRLDKRSSITSSEFSDHSPTRVAVKNQYGSQESNDFPNSTAAAAAAAHGHGQPSDAMASAEHHHSLELSNKSCRPIEDPHTSGSADDVNAYSSGTITYDQQTAITSANPSPLHKRMSSVNSQTSSNLRMPPRPLAESILRAREVSHQFSQKSIPDNASVEQSEDQEYKEIDNDGFAKSIIEIGGGIESSNDSNKTQSHDVKNANASTNLLPGKKRHSHVNSVDYPSDISRFDEVDSGVYAKSHRGYIINPSEDISLNSHGRYDEDNNGMVPIIGAPLREKPEEVTDIIDIEELEAQAHSSQYRDASLHQHQIYDDTKDHGHRGGGYHSDGAVVSKDAVEEDYYDIGEPVMVRNQPARGKSVRENTRRTKRKKSTKHKNKKELKPFTYTTLVSLLESMNGTVIGEEFNQLNLPIREKQWIEKIIDSLSRLTSDMVMDENKFEAGLTRLEKAHSALEGFL